MLSAFVIDAVRTPIGKYGGSLAGCRPDDLLAHVLGALLRRNPLVDPGLIEDVIAGDANQAGEDNRNVARMASLLAGLPPTVAGYTVNRLCASGLQAVMDAARAIMCQEGDLYIAAGVESMTRAPFILAKAPQAFSREAECVDSTLGWRFINKKLAERYHPYSMGETAENIATKWQISRQAQDEFALDSQHNYFKALEAGKWTDEICPVEVHGSKKGSNLFDTDEQPRADSSLEKLLGLRPAFAEGGTVTAGNSSSINDGAAALLLASERALVAYNLKPMARISVMAVAGVDPAYMGIGPVPATRKVLQRAGLMASDLDLVELNEAFAVQSLACIRDLGLDPQKVNVNGGAIALGHPLGCSGARISTTLLHEMKRRKVKWGLATMCVGVGQGASILYESL